MRSFDAIVHALPYAALGGALLAKFLPWGKSRGRDATAPVDSAIGTGIYGFADDVPSRPLKPRDYDVAYRLDPLEIVPNPFDDGPHSLNVHE